MTLRKSGTFNKQEKLPLPLFHSNDDDDDENENITVIKSFSILWKFVKETQPCHYYQITHISNLCWKWLRKMEKKWTQNAHGRSIKHYDEAYPYTHTHASRNDG